MPTYRLSYFDIRGIAEPIRLIFAVAGVEFEDKRITEEQWPSEKTSGKYPFGTMPILEVDGVTLAQSYAIARYLANEFGLAGKTNMEKAQVDMVADAVKDFGEKMGKMFMEKDEEKKAEIIKTVESKDAPVYLAAIEKILTSNKDGDGYFVGESLTWADLTFVNQTEYYPMFGSDVLVPYPKLKALVDRVNALPKIKAWKDKRPETKY
ncbi:glutathione S-transferase 1-like [Glandiceps talaboti]